MIGFLCLFFFCSHDSFSRGTCRVNPLSLFDKGHKTSPVEQHSDFRSTNTVVRVFFFCWDLLVSLLKPVCSPGRVKRQLCLSPLSPRTRNGTLRTFLFSCTLQLLTFNLCITLTVTMVTNSVFHNKTKKTVTVIISHFEKKKDFLLSVDTKAHK